MSRRLSLSASLARRIALAAQGFGQQRPAGPVNAGHIKRAIDRLGLLQIDSVNVLARAHYLPLFSRLGNYDGSDLDRLAWGRRSQRGLFEFWAHEASLLPLAAHPLLRWRMQRARDSAGDGKGKLHAFRRDKAAYIDDVLREITDRGPIAASELSNAGERRGTWWGWNDGKRAVEWLFFAGLVTTATRRGAFERVYDITERVLPAHIRDLPTPSQEEAQRALLRHAARALGVGTEFDLRDYFRLGVADTKARLAELIEAGDLLPVKVEGWDRPAYLDPAARQPRKLEARALLAPFDPLIWERDRTLRIFDFFYRIGIYTPAAKRTHGYYVLPFLLGDRLVARVDLKADRAESTLVVHAAHLEAGQNAKIVAGPLREELRLMADWLGLERVWLPRVGVLAKAMARMR
ncbi:MAG: winged helix-turn-helix domain-containing protein [Alphaproteobacteria bacterium]|nr:winged helix-turn-helix domain-containing protein [Alphaproteobacteria bacterium]